MYVYNVIPGMIPILLTNYISYLQHSWVVCTYPQHPRPIGLFMARTDSRVVIRNSEASGLVRSKACDSVQLTMTTSNEGSGMSTFAVRAAARGVGHSCCLHGLERRVRNHQFSTSHRHQGQWSRRCTRATSLCCGIVNSKFAPVTSRWCGFLAISCRWSTVLSRSPIRF
jgi:hypothetical protein